jgi:geranylgeranyl reductase family protein
VCGDGSPRARSDSCCGWASTSTPRLGPEPGLRIIGGGQQLELPWPTSPTTPFGLVRTRTDFDEILVGRRRSRARCCRESTAVTGPLLDERTGRVVGVRARELDPDGRRSGAERTFRAPVVVAADGNSARLALGLGLQRREDRPMGVAVRTYYRSPRHDDDWLESWLELWDGDPSGGGLLPGYGWIFGVGDGTSNVGLGILDTSRAFRNVDYRQLLRRWLDSTRRVGISASRNPHRAGARRALPMGFNRTPHYSRGLLLVGDAAALVNPFNGEGIAYAMESGEMAAEVIVQAIDRPEQEHDRALAAYPQALDARYGGYYTLGRVFVQLIGHPAVMRAATQHGTEAAHADALHAEAARQPHRRARRRCHGPHHQRSQPARSGGVSMRAVTVTVTGRSAGRGDCEGR